MQDHVLKPLSSQSPNKENLSPNHTPLDSLTASLNLSSSGKPNIIETLKALQYVQEMIATQESLLLEETNAVEIDSMNCSTNNDEFKRNGIASFNGHIPTFIDENDKCSLIKSHNKLQLQSDAVLSHDCVFESCDSDVAVCAIPSKDMTLEDLEVTSVRHVTENDDGGGIVRLSHVPASCEDKEFSGNIK